MVGIRSSFLKFFHVVWTSFVLLNIIWLDAGMARDLDGDGKQGLPEAIRTAQKTDGSLIPQIKYLLEVLSGYSTDAPPVRHSGIIELPAALSDKQLWVETSLGKEKVSLQNSYSVPGFSHGPQMAMVTDKDGNLVLCGCNPGKNYYYTG